MCCIIFRYLWFWRRQSGPETKELQNCWSSALYLAGYFPHIFHGSLPSPRKDNPAVFSLTFCYISVFKLKYILESLLPYDLIDPICPRARKGTGFKMEWKWSKTCSQSQTSTLRSPWEWRTAGIPWPPSLFFQVVNLWQQRWRPPPPPILPSS